MSDSAVGLRTSARVTPIGPATVAGLLLAAVLIWKVGLFLADALWATSYPYELDYGEGIVWQQMRMLFAGEAYGSIDGFPAIVFHYTPLYHAVTGAVAALTGADELAAGRAVSILSTLAAALFVALATMRLLPAGSGRRARWICGAGAGLIALSWFPVTFWAPLMRVDMLAYALSMGGVWIALLALKRPLLIHMAALLFVAALFTKQTMIAAPAAIFLVLLCVRPRTGLMGIGTAIASGLVALLLLSFAFGGSFLRHIFLYNVNRIDFDRLSIVLNAVGAHAVLVGIAVISAIGCISRLRRTVPAGVRAGEVRRLFADDDEAIGLLFVLAYLLTTFLMLVTISKVGSSINYLIEWMLVLSIFVGLALRDTAVLVSRSAHSEELRRSPTTAVLIPAALVLQLFFLPERSLSAREVLNGQFAQLSARIAATDKPVISDDMVLLLRSGRSVLWEPAIFSELASTNLYDEGPFIAKIRRRDFAFFVTMGQRGWVRFDERYSPAVADALYDAYPRKEELAGLTLHLPAE